MGVFISWLHRGIPPPSIPKTKILSQYQVLLTSKTPFHFCTTAPVDILHYIPTAEPDTNKANMQTYRIVPRTAPRACKSACNPAASRNMFTTPFFPGHYNPVAELAPLFRAFDSAVAELTPNAERAARHQRRSFNPRFDVREVGSNYELQGELPGIDQKDLEIEFVDDKTLVIRGKSERQFENTNTQHYVDQTTAAPAVEGAKDNIDAASEKSASYHKASVEDEDGFVDAGAETETPDVAKGKAPEATSEAADPETSVPEAKTSEPQFKYWVSERSVGEFERRFAFPGKVDQEAVKASLRNGILSVVVPKIVEQSARRIEIQ